MRHASLSLAMALLAFAAVSCTSNENKPTSAAVKDLGKPTTLRVKDRDVLVLTLPAESHVYYTGNLATIVGKMTPQRFYIWTVDEPTVDAAVAKVPHILKPEFVAFHQTAAEDTTVAGVPARKLTGTGTEADDGDPGDAEIVVFAMGRHVFVACVHGEGIPAYKRDLMMSALATAHAP